jgi:hypothetical protein
MGQIVPPQPDDVVAWITVRHHADGSVSTSGTVGDKRYAQRLLDIAKDAIKNRISDSPLAIPNYDVDASTAMPQKEMAHIPIAERGDP